MALMDYLKPAIVYDFNTNKVEQINIFAYVCITWYM